MKLPAYPDELWRKGELVILKSKATCLSVV